MSEEKKPRRPRRPVGMPGHLKPYRKPTVLQYEARVDRVEELIMDGARKSRIHAAMREEFGVHWTTVDRYILRAKQRLLDSSRQSKDEHRRASLAFYQGVRDNPKATHSDRIKAAARIDELLGLDAPRRTELSGPAGGPIPTRDDTPLPKLTRARLAELAGVEEQGRNGGNGH